jgi:hypothetical protein
MLVKVKSNYIYINPSPQNTHKNRRVGNYKKFLGTNKLFLVVPAVP